MAHYSVSTGARHILNNLLNDPALAFADSIKDASRKVQFEGIDQPFLPTPFKFGDTVAALFALVASGAHAVAEDRFGIQQDVSVNIDKAIAFLAGFILTNIDGVPVATASQSVRDCLDEADIYKLAKPIHFQATNQFLCKDGRFYHLHFDFNASPVMKMLGIPEQDVSHEEAHKIYAAKAAEWDTETLDDVTNNQYRQSGCICYSPEEFFSTKHGQAMSKEPVAKIVKREAPRKQWPAPTATNQGPLAGIRIIDSSRAIAAPCITRVLAALGADVIRLSCSSIPDSALTLVDLSAGKRDVSIDLKTESGKVKLREMVRGADVFIDGFRPKAMEKLGFDPSSLRKLNPSLIHVSENCYGWTGLWCGRSGWQNIADAVTGIAWAQGEYFGRQEPVQPLLPNADYQTGVLGAALVINALQKRTVEDATYDIQVSLVSYDIWLYRQGLYSEDVIDYIKKQNLGFDLRHNTRFIQVVQKTVEQVKKLRPGLLEDEDLWNKISGTEWGEKKDISIVGLPFRLSKSPVEYLVPSGKRGWSTHNAQWVDFAQ